MLAVMLLDEIGTAATIHRSNLPVVRPEIECPRLKLFRKFNRMKFQIFDFEKHRKTPRAVRQRPKPAEARQEDVSTARSKS